MDKKNLIQFVNKFFIKIVKDFQKEDKFPSTISFTFLLFDKHKNVFIISM